MSAPNLIADADGYEWPRCVACNRHLWNDEGYACRVCQERADAALAALAGPVKYSNDKEQKIVSGLYAALDSVLIPGRTGSNGPVTGSRHAPIPIRLEPLSLSARGGIVTVLQSWQADWHERLGWTHPRWSGGMQQQCNQVVHALRVNLPWAASEHPAFDEFARELATTVRACRAAVTGERGERPLKVLCAADGCGGILRITLSCEGRRCPRCNTQYGHNDLMDLDLAARSLAA